MPSLKAVGKRVLSSAGYDVRRRQPPGSHLRPIGQQDSVLADFRARGFRPSLIFDVGASDGSWTNAVRPIFPAARFVTVEPRNTGVEPTVHAAVGAHEGVATLTDWDTGSTLIAADPKGAAQYQVPITTLNCLAQQFGTPDFVKLDVEGFELEALKGADTLLGRTELFVIEVALYRFTDRPLLHEVVAFMAERGYFVCDVAGFIRRPTDGAVGLMDLCFARTLRGSETEW
jgi:FkbM family methyltransferase